LIRYQNSLKDIGITSLSISSMSIVEGGPIDILKKFLSNIEKATVKVNVNVSCVD